jgi:predicted AlkP superfamily phosphohydrolase/phosphomutase
MTTPDLTVIGLDAATFDVIDPLVAAGELPNLERVLQSGAYGPLRSTTPPLTPLAWTTMVTGVNAADHGIWDFSHRAEGGYALRLVNGSHRTAAAVWDRLSAAGHRVGVVNVPFTWPAPDVDGFVVAGMDASGRDDGMTHPRDLIRELTARFGAQDLDHGFPLDDHGQVDLDRVRRACESRVAATLWLCDRFEPRLVLVVFMAADHVQHLCWPEWVRDGAASRVAEVYRILDRAVGELRAGLGEGGDTMVVSDHGAGALHGVVSLNAWLEREGFLAYGYERGTMTREIVRKTAYRAFALRRAVPEVLRRRVKQRIPRIRERSYRLGEFSVVDWSRTRAFAYGTFGNVVINVRGRERSGIVEPGVEYERTRDEVAVKALGLQGLNGERIVAAVHKREDLFDGPRLDRIPDLLIEFDEYAWLGRGTLKSRPASIWDEISPPGGAESYVGSHRHNGIFALAGPSARRGQVARASILDVAPTLLYVLGEAIPTNLEGRILSEAIEPAVLDERSPEYVDPVEFEPQSRRSATPDASAEVEERLRSLGYLE